MSADDRTARPEGLLAQHAWVRSLARTLVRNDADADDLAQEAWLAALRSPPTGTGSVRGWFAAVLRNASRQSHRGGARREKREQASARREARESAHEVVSRAEEHRRVVDAVLALAEPYRTAILLRYFDELPPREVAARTGVPLETARARIRRALDRLRERLDASHGGDGAAWKLALCPLAGFGPEHFLGGPCAASAPASALSTSLTTGAITMAATTTVAVGGVALVAGLAIAWLAGSGDRSDYSTAVEELAEARTAAEMARVETEQARDAAKRKDGRIAELEAEVRRVREELTSAETRAGKLATDLAAAQSDADRTKSPDAPKGPSGPAIAFPEYADAFGQVSWDSVAEHTTAMVGPLKEIADAILAGRDVPLQAAGEAQKHNGPLIQAVGVVQGKLSGIGPNGAYTHPAFQVNALVAALERIGQPATGAQLTSLEDLGRRFSEEERKRVASYGDATFQMQRIVEEGDLKDRFFDAMRRVLTAEQLEVLSPESARDRTSIDLWSEGLFWAQFASPLRFTTREQLAEGASRIVGPSLRLDDAQRAKAATLVADWASRLPADLVERTPDALERTHMFPCSVVAKAAAQTRALVERIATELALAGDQLAAARRFGVVLYPLPGAAGDDGE